ncbi:MAG: DUF2807 domain-containing protein [Bacteroidia bacterium]
MKNLISTFFTLIILTNISLAQNEVSGSFNEIKISGSAKIFISQGAQSTVTISGSQNLGGINISNNKLHISSVFHDPIYVHIPELNKVDISGNGEIIMDSLFNIDNLKLDVSGNCKTDLNIKGGTIQLDVSGNFTGDIKGTADALKVNASGRANVYAENLVVKNCDVNVSGLSKVQVDVKDSLNTRISGKGTVVYKTPPAYINTDNSGLARMGDCNSSAHDTTRILFGKTTVLIIGNDGNYGWQSKDGPRKAQFHWAGVEMGFNNYLNSDNKFDVPPGYGYLDLNTGKSVFVNLNIFEYKFKLYHEYIMLGTGFGFSFRNYYFVNKDSILVADAEVVSAAPAQRSYTKNKLAVDYISIPLLLEFNTSRYNKNSFHFGGGIVFNYKIGSRVKLKYDDGKEKIHNSFNLRPVEFDARAHIGYGELNLFATYSLQTLFKDNRGPELTPITFGITLGGW